MRRHSDSRHEKLNAEKHRIEAALQNSIAEMRVNLEAQIGELDRLRDQIRIAQLSARRSRLLVGQRQKKAKQGPPGRVRV
jgi:hypothetical protein